MTLNYTFLIISPETLIYISKSFKNSFPLAIAIAVMKQIAPKFISCFLFNFTL